MKRWQKHIVGFVLPATVAAITTGFAPKYYPPAWMTNLSVAGMVIALSYVTYLYYRLAGRSDKYAIIPVVRFLVGLTGAFVGRALQSPVVATSAGLIPLAGIFLVTGSCTRFVAKRGLAK